MTTELASAEPVVDDRTTAIRSLEGELGRLLHHVRRFIAESAERLSPGMLPGTYRVFATIYRERGVTLSTLAEILMADKGQMSRAVRELEELGFIQRTQDPEDRRSSIITATPLGHERLESARAPRQDAFEKTLSDWSLDDLHHLSRLLHALTEDMSR